MKKVNDGSGNSLIVFLDGASSDIIALDREISTVMEGEDRSLWEGKFWGGTDQSIIGYGDLSYTRSDGTLVEYFNVGLAQQKNYISVYIHGLEDGKYLAETYGPAVGKVKVGKSSISFKKLEDIDLDALLEIVVKSRDCMK